MHLVRSVGADIARAWNHFVEQNPKALDIASTYGGGNCEPDKEVGEAWTKVLEKLLKAKDFEDIIVKEEFEFTTPLNTKLWAAWIKATGDPECHVVEWARKGVPLGMNCKIPTCGIFPTMAVEEVAMEDAPIMDLLQGTKNYSSFYDLVEAAEEEIARYVSKGFAVIKNRRWLMERFGSGTVSRMALIQKVKEDGKVKNRIVVDMLRSGGNSRAQVPERLVLPRVMDVLESARRLWAANDDFIKLAKKEGWCPEKEDEMREYEMVGADLQDAFCHFPVMLEEVSNCVCPGFSDEDFILYTALLFGFKAAPLLMARLSALVSRFLQSLFVRGEGCLQTYMDDPWFMLAGPLMRRNRNIAMILYSLYAMGVNVAYHKGERGLRVTWIGVVFELDLAREVMKLTVSQKMMRELLVKLKDWEGAGMIGLRELRATTGRLSWMAGILTRTRWAVSIFYGVVAAAEKDIKQGTEQERASKRAKDQRSKEGLVAVSRFEMPRAWLAHLLAKSDQLLLRVEPLFPLPPDLALITDASPQGIGAILGRVDLQQNKIEPWAALEIALKKEDADWLGVEWAQPSSQGALEAWAVLLGVRFWKLRLRQLPILIKSDSTVALAMAAKLSSSSPVLNWIGAELALKLEVLCVPKLVAHHLPGQLNVEADWLSRSHDRPKEVPAKLQKIKIHRFDGEARRRSELPPPGVCPRLWGLEPKTVLQAFEQL